MMTERTKKLAVWRQKLIRWLSQAGGKLEVALSRILASCTRDTPCRNAACPMCGLCYQIVGVAAIEELLDPHTRKFRGRMSLVTIIPEVGLIAPGQLRPHHYGQVKAKVEAAFRENGLEPALGCVEASFEEDLSGRVADHWALHAHVIVAEWLSLEQTAGLISAFPRSDRIGRPVMWQRLDDELAVRAYPFKPERFRGVSQDFGVTDRKPPRQRELRHWQAVELARVEHQVGLVRKLISHGIDIETLHKHFNSMKRSRDT